MTFIHLGCRAGPLSYRLIDVHNNFIFNRPCLQSDRQTISFFYKGIFFDLGRRSPSICLRVFLAGVEERRTGVTCSAKPRGGHDWVVIVPGRISLNLGETQGNKQEKEGFSSTSSFVGNCRRKRSKMAAASTVTQLDKAEEMFCNLQDERCHRQRLHLKPAHDNGISIERWTRDKRLQRVSDQQQVRK
jgi:hypothetical protein